ADCFICAPAVETLRTAVPNGDKVTREIAHNNGVLCALDNVGLFPQPFLISLAFSYVRPHPHHLLRFAPGVAHDPVVVLYPMITAVLVPKPVFHRIAVPLERFGQRPYDPITI